jgi:hypothetical protein
VKLHLLRGRVAIRPILETRIGSILMPETHNDWTRDGQHKRGILAKSSHFAKVLGKGPPAIGVHGHEVPHGFEVGDTVNFALHMSEKWSDGQVWEDGEPCMFIAQEHVNGVLEP